MRAEGARLAQTCTARGCGHWSPLSIDALIGKHGADWRPWDRRPICVRCSKPGHYMASPGPSTPFRPMLSGPEAEMARKAFLKSFGFTKRDLLRIRALAERVAAGEYVGALSDLDVPYRVAACKPGQETRFSGELLGEWAGQSLLFWRMNESEARVWEANRRQGPKPL